jgi:hypothetical protein
MRLVQSLLATVQKGDVCSLEAYIEHQAFHGSHLIPTHVRELWETCWDMWDAYEPQALTTLGTFMATLKAAYPWLQGKPSWAPVDDPEAL